MAANTRHTIVFKWDVAEFDALLESCNYDDGVQLAIRHLPKSGKILEAGCGAGRVVRFFRDRGYDIEGFELNTEIVAQLRKTQPDLAIFAGDVAELPRPDGYYGGLLSYGTVEHFIAGLEAPLREHQRVLAKGGIAIITVPGYNGLRRVKHALDLAREWASPRRNPVIRRALGRKPLRRNRRGKDGWRYHVYPQHSDFFEYRLRPAEFESAVRAAGFKILESLPISHLDGLYHEFGPPLIEFRDWKFNPTPLAHSLDRVLRTVPFFHNHMHAVVATK